MATPQQITVANKTSRNSPAVGAKALTPKMVRTFVDNNKGKKGTSILDFGAGKHAIHAQALQDEGYFCMAYEFGDNVDPELHATLALSNKYDVVYASNVLNVQSDEAMLVETIKQVKSVMKHNSTFFANYPLDPRKSGLSTQEVFDILCDCFSNVMWVDGKKNAPVWMMEK